MTYYEPFPDIDYPTVKARADFGLKPAGLAETYADTTRKLGALYRDFGDPEYERLRVRISERCELWEELEETLYARIVERLERESATPLSSAMGEYNIVKPFMERNGYRGKNGCWIKE